MRSRRVLLLVLCVAGCASTTTQVRAPGDDWQAYRQEIMRQRDDGKLSPVEAQAQIEKKFQELYDSDPAMDGSFAYSDELLQDAEAGDLTMSEAVQLSDARQDEALVEFKETVKQRELEEKTFPPEQDTSD